MSGLAALCMPGHPVTVNRVVTPRYDGWVTWCDCGSVGAGQQLSVALELVHQPARWVFAGAVA